MAGLLDPNRSALPDSADTIVINGETCPGKCTVMKPSSPREFDIKYGFGFDGAYIMPKGARLSHFSVLVEIWTGADYLAWKAFAAKYFSKSTVTPPGSTVGRALGIYHPLLAAPPICISEVLVEDIIANGQDEDGLWSWEIKFLEFKQPKAIPQQQPPAAVPAVVKETPTAQDSAQRQMQQLFGAFAKLQGGG